MFCGGSSTFNALRIAPTNTTDFVPVPTIGDLPAGNLNGSTYQVSGNTVTIILAGSIPDGGPIAIDTTTDANIIIGSNVSFVPAEFLPLKNIAFSAIVTINDTDGTLRGVSMIPITFNTDGTITWVFSSEITAPATLEYDFGQISYVLNVLGP